MPPNPINLKGPVLAPRTSLPLAWAACEKCATGLLSFFIWLVFQMTGRYEVTEAPPTAAVMWALATHVSAGWAAASSSLQVGDLGEHHVASGWVHVVQLAGLKHNEMKQVVRLNIHQTSSPLTSTQKTRPNFLSTIWNFFLAIKALNAFQRYTRANFTWQKEKIYSLRKTRSWWEKQQPLYVQWPCGYCSGIFHSVSR